MGQFSYFYFVLIFFVLKSEAQSSSLNCNFNSNDCAWYSYYSLMPTWEWTGVLERDDHGGYLQIPTTINGIGQLMSKNGLSQFTTSVLTLWRIPQSGCFTFSYRFYTTSDSKLSLTLEYSFGEKKVLWNIDGPQSKDWSRASVYIDSLDSDFRLHFDASIALKNSNGLQADWIVSLDDFTFSHDKCSELTSQMSENKIEEALPDIMANTGETIFTSWSVYIDKLACFSFTYFYTIANSKKVGSLLIMLETMSSDGKQAAKPRRILPIEKISLQREFSLDRNHFERTIIVDEKSFYKISLVYADKAHSSVVIVDNVSIKTERCSNESPKQDSDITVAPATETPSPTTTECCVTEPCICVQSTEMPTFNPSGVTTFVSPSTVPISTVDQDINSTPNFSTRNTISVASETEGPTTQDQSTTLETLSSTTIIFSTESIVSERSTTQSTEAQTKDQPTTLASSSSKQTTVHLQDNETPLEETTSSRSELQSTSMDYIISTITDRSLETTETTNETVVTTIDQKHETLESSSQSILTTNYQKIEPISNSTQNTLVTLDIRTVEHDNRTNPFNAISFGYLGMNLIAIFKFCFGQRSLIASLSGLAGLSILVISILILALNWKKQAKVRQRPAVISTANGELELDTYTFRRRTITLSRLEDMSSSKPPLKLSKSVDV